MAGHPVWSGLRGFFGVSGGKTFLVGSLTVEGPAVNGKPTVMSRKNADFLRVLGILMIQVEFIDSKIIRY